MFDLSDLQGNVLRGYKDKPYVRYLILEVADRNAARRWLAAADLRPRPRCAADHLGGLGESQATDLFQHRPDL